MAVASAHCQVKSISEEPGNGAKVVAFSHELMEGTRIGFRGVSGAESLSDGTFIVARIDNQHAFWISKEVRSQVCNMDADGGVVQTATPHGLRSWVDSVQLVDFEGESAGEVNGRSFEVICCPDRCRIKLGTQAQNGHGRIPMSFSPGLTAGFVIADPQAGRATG
eukprot:TRINITY_DN11935_c0_g1_i2.p2 TRINITY_DN11935_c0_g1~~TRINITY_DN11935_c0_g1_i2.p2  ORF type:complete len:165 (+),score=22.11 TRINITY_DN11935_c0_g1_i2:141-635(+)